VDKIPVKAAYWTMSLMPPTAGEQIRFLVNLQRLLEEGSFVASYKFALLLSLADLSIENGDDSGAPLKIDVTEIAEKFIQYYWRQVIPYPSPSSAKILQQNTGRQAAIINSVSDARITYDSLPRLLKEQGSWSRLL
jgi:hypothetical protein